MKVGDTVFVGRGPEKGLTGRIVKVLKNVYRVRATQDNTDDNDSYNEYYIGEEYDVDKSCIDQPKDDLKKLELQIREKSVELSGLFLKKKMLLNPELAVKKVEEILEALIT